VVVLFTFVDKRFDPAIPAFWNSGASSISEHASSISERRPFAFWTTRGSADAAPFDKAARVFWKAEKASPNFALVG